MIYLDLTCFDLTCPDLPFRYIPHTICTPNRHSPDTCQTSKGQLSDTHQTPARHQPYTLQTISKHPPDNHKTATKFLTCRAISWSEQGVGSFFFFLLVTGENNTSLAALGALAHCLQRRTACNILPPATPYRLFDPKWPTWSGHRSILRLLDPPINFC